MNYTTAKRQIGSTIEIDLWKQIQGLLNVKQISLAQAIRAALMLWIANQEMKEGE